MLHCNGPTLRCRFHFALYAEVSFVFSHAVLLNLLQYICRKESLLPDHNCKVKTRDNLILCQSHLFSAGYTQPALADPCDGYSSLDSEDEHSPRPFPCAVSAAILRDCRPVINYRGEWRKGEAWGVEKGGGLRGGERELGHNFFTLIKREGLII